MNGVLLINKEKNKTSRDMVNELCHIFNTKKIGHTGTLDPIATGVLVMVIGRYTKMVDMLSSLEKEYIGTILLGKKTDTLDITGNVLEERKCIVDKDDLLKVIVSMKGKYLEEIPKYSAKKINGKKLYEYARNNEEVILPKEEIEIYDISLVSMTDDRITLKFNVSKGTYIRALIKDICDKLDVIGTMEDLIRTGQGSFTIDDTYTIEDIKKGNYKLMKASDILLFNSYNLNNEEYHKVLNGNKLFLDLNDSVIICKYDNEDIAIYEKEDNYYKIKVLLK